MTHDVDGFPGREIIVDGERFLYFGGTAYLGLQTDLEFQDIFIKNIKKFGTNYGASRNANIRLQVYEKAEKYLANLIGSESAITLSSGYLSGQIIAKYFLEKGNTCFYTPGAHESLHLSRTKSFENYGTLTDNLSTTIEEGADPVLFLDSISLDGKNYPGFDWLKELPLKRITLVVDDSHGFGIVGKNGGGVFRAIGNLKPKELIVCGSLGKGFGIQAGIVAGNDRLIADLKVSDMYAASSPASPASIATLIESSKILSQKRKLLQENVDCFLSKLADSTHLNYMPEYPSFAFSDNDLSTHLRKHNIIVTDFNYPTENDPVVQRIVLSAQHTTEDILKLANSVNVYID